MAVTCRYRPFDRRPDQICRRYQPRRQPGRLRFLGRSEPHFPFPVPPPPLCLERLAALGRGGRVLRTALGILIHWGEAGARGHRGRARFQIAKLRVSKHQNFVLN